MDRKILVTLMLALSLLAAACGGIGDDDGGPGSGGGDGGDDPTIDHPTGADELILRLEQGGGFVPVEYNLRNFPGVSIYGDGRMIVQGPVIEIYPGPALPNLQVTRLTEDAIQAILAEAEAAGLLGPDASYDYPCVTDLPTTTFSVNADGATHTTSAYALGFADGGMSTGQCEGVDVAAREELLDFSTKLGHVRGWLPAGSFSDEEPFAPSALRVYVTKYRGAGEPELEQPEVVWPLDTALDRFGEPDVNLQDYRCGVVEGQDLDALLPEAQAANERTPWVSGGATYGLVFRPLLPDESGC
jgi:hypothetical protein